MNPVYNLTITSTKDLDVSEAIESQDCKSAAECKHKMRQLILSKHPSYWKRAHRITAQYKGQTLILDPQEVMQFETLQKITT